MTVWCYFRGHEIYKDKRKPWKLFETGEVLTEELKETLACPRCGMLPTPEGHDACCANTPGVKNMCCGHGVEPGYTQYTNGIVIREGKEE
jgi:hypothetical protein